MTGIGGWNRYPGQEHKADSSKIPTILYYDKEGVVRAAGADVHRAEIQEQADEEEWIKVEWYGLKTDGFVLLHLAKHNDTPTGSSFVSNRSRCQLS